MSAEMWQLIVTAIITLVGSSTTAAIITTRVSGRRNSRELSFQIIDYFFKEYHTIGEVLHLLEKKSPRIDEQINDIRKIGDWLNLLALLKKNKVVEWELLKNVGLEKTMEDFHSRINTRKADGQGSLEGVWGWWPDLHLMYQPMYQPRG